jgi:ADP-ribose pyrophosphatase YjhB (NUDIX family)
MSAEPDERQPMAGAPPHNTTSVGAVVRRGDELLLVRLNYGPTGGRFSFPGGLLDPGEELPSAAEREAFEETGVRARCVGVIGLRTRSERQTSQTDVIWLLEHLSGEPSPCSDECDAACYLSFDEIAQRADRDIEPLVTRIAERLRAGTLTPHRLVGPNTDGGDGADGSGNADNGAQPETWRLFL